ncbi:hypothetical protein WH221_05970 [Chryseobacterium culicis]|uniref:Uncharacterized protein n=1 Tax=Chryseobacterium culicis TaxID=680127 RepID=A0A2S9CZ51_CHRCI|nr:hypothetical protein [Chryseobacterium culicis]PRB85795.1 hypothetical protein CQ022_05935 [Chryseobacterium culicis]PRB90481.1 hypothetical protein CQ033_07050 [Chryseobacterium culicis]
MSAISALRGYRTQFLYSLHYILSTLENNLIYRLEGEEDLDVLDHQGELLYAIQLKNLGKTITLSDILSDKKTSFVKRFLEKYISAIPVLVSYGEVSTDLSSWNQHANDVSVKEKAVLKKYKISEEQWKLVKSKIQFEEVVEETIAEEVEKMMKKHFPEIDPIPTIGYLLNLLQLIAEKQQPTTAKDFYSKVQDFASYLTERIALHEQYGLVLKPLHKVSTDNVNIELLEKEFYNATLTRYEHILCGLDVSREEHLEKIKDHLVETNVVIVKGASGQGKTALLYSYVHHYINVWLSFELKIQQDPVISQQSIQAIAAISKKLDMPVVFVINVTPNATDWLQIVKESAHFSHIKFLVAIRNEDWYRATTVGIEFSHHEIDLFLSMSEAEMIYSRLNKRSMIHHFTDFEEAWIQMGEDIPLLEFVYSITQGNSLYNKLKHQVQQIVNEGSYNSNKQIGFLRIVSLADSLGAKIDVSKLDENVDYQFIVEKLENEYLIKRSADRKYIQGLHIVRSAKLVEILFDSFTNSKREYAYKCVSVIAEEDLYLFLLQLFYEEVFEPEFFISDLSKQIAVNNWSIYIAIIKAFIWAGIHQYVEQNRAIIDECQVITKGAWVMFVDIRFGNNYDTNAMLDLVNADDEFRKMIDDINERLLPKQHVFNLAISIINKLPFPEIVPHSTFEWRSYGEALFWLRNIPNDKETVPDISESHFESAFKTMDSKSLSKLMLGMYSYSLKLNMIREEYIEYFIERIKKDFDIIHFSINEDQVNVHFVIDIIKYDFERSTNGFAVNILDIVRAALPDKKQFNSQGHGHRFKQLSLDYDATHKTISIENMHLEEWVNINSCLIKLYDYKNRPADWNEYRILLNQWEMLGREKINEYNNAFKQLFKERNVYTPIVPIMHNALFEWPESILEPQSITDPLGIYRTDKNQSSDENVKLEINKKLISKYEKFFESLSGFKGSFETFMKQSAETIYSKARLKTEKGYIHNENTERLSQVNLFDSIKKLRSYNLNYKDTFGSVDSNHVNQIETNALLVTATFWKDFLSDSTNGDHSFKRILKLKDDFEKKIIKACKAVSTSNIFSVQYINNSTTGGKPVFIIDSDNPLLSLTGYREVYMMLRQIIDTPEATSLKYLMLELWFPKIYIIQTVREKSMNHLWYEIRFYTIVDNPFEKQGVVNTIPKRIDENIIEKLKIESWAALYPEISEVLKVSESYGRLVFLVDHFHDLRHFDDLLLNESEIENLKQHTDKICAEIQQSLQAVLDALVLWVNMFPIDEVTYLADETERAYFETLLNIKDNICPESMVFEDNAKINLDMKLASEWLERLNGCTLHWGTFLLLLQGKIIDSYQNKIPTINQ